MVRIRLSRHGRKHLPHYRIVVTPQREKRESHSIEEIGHYNPVTKELKIEKERAQYWLSVGAQPSETVKYLFTKEGVMPKAEAKPAFKGKPGKKATARAEAKSAKEEAAKAKAEAPAEEVKPEEVPAETAA